MKNSTANIIAYFGQYDYSEKWREVHIDKDTTGQEVLHPGKKFFLSDLAKIWNCKLIK